MKRLLLFILVAGLFAPICEAQELDAAREAHMQAWEEAWAVNMDALDAQEEAAGAQVATLSAEVEAWKAEVEAYEKSVLAAIAWNSVGVEDSPNEDGTEKAREWLASARTLFETIATRAVEAWEALQE